MSSGLAQLGRNDVASDLSAHQQLQAANDGLRDIFFGDNIHVDAVLFDRPLCRRANGRDVQVLEILLQPKFGEPLPHCLDAIRAG